MGPLAFLTSSPELLLVQPPHFEEEGGVDAAETVLTRPLSVYVGGDKQ